MRQPRPRVARLITLVGCAVMAAAMTAGATRAIAVPRPMDVTVFGRTMHIVCTGPMDGARPTVLFEAGYGGESSQFADVIRRVAARDVSACAYDRAGLGASFPTPGPMTV